MSTWFFLAVVTLGENAPAQVGPPAVKDEHRVRLLPPVPDETAPRKPDVVLRWNEALLHAVKMDGTAPPLAARNMAIVNVAVFEAVNAIYRTHQPYLTDVRPLTGASPSAAAATAAHRTLTSLYPKQRKTFDDLLRVCLAEAADPLSRDAGMALGEFVADKVLERRAQDVLCFGGKHAPARAAGIWEPTGPAFGEALLPDWVKLTPFCIREGCLPRPPGPPPLGSAAYTAAFREVHALGGKASPHRTPEQTEIARFWADGEGTSTPPGHWNRIARDVAQARGTSLEENARLFALLNLSLADAGLACWIIKFHHNVWRPLTGIRRADEDGNPDTPSDRDWEPLLTTPPFPAYTSGHSTFSGAAATVLAKFFGSDEVRFETTSEGLPGVRRSFTRFSTAAEEAGKSRVYGGIHWEFDNRDGLANGRALGEHVIRHYLLPRR
jgi:hypothetical protein